MSRSTSRLGIEVLSVFAMPPVPFIGLAAELGCSHISLGLEPMPDNPHSYPAWSLRQDATLRKETVAALADNAISIAFGEGFVFRPGVEVRDMADDFALMAELGAKCVNAVGIDPDRARSEDQFGAFADMAAANGLRASIEFMPGLALGTLAAANTLIDAVGRTNLGVVIDCMHLIRSGGSAQELAAFDPARIAHIQLCDAPLTADMAQYPQEAKGNRLCPGEGELPLAEILAALPRDIVVGLEVPMLAKAQQGIGPKDRLQPCVDAANALLKGIAQ